MAPSIALPQLMEPIIGLATETNVMNCPVNMEAIRTFYPEDHCGDRIRYFTIKFEYTNSLDTAFTTTWKYPPTDEGEKMRDDDLAWLYRTFCQRAKSY